MNARTKLLTVATAAGIVAGGAFGVAAYAAAGPEAARSVTELHPGLASSSSSPTPHATDDGRAPGTVRIQPTGAPRLAATTNPTHDLDDDNGGLRTASDDVATHRSSDDPATHDLGDDNGGLRTGSDDSATHRSSDDPATHDLGDDNGGLRTVSDDAASHRSSDDSATHRSTAPMTSSATRSGTSTSKPAAAATETVDDHGGRNGTGGSGVSGGGSSGSGHGSDDAPNHG